VRTEKNLETCVSLQELRNPVDPLPLWEANRHQYVPDLLDEPAFCHWGGPPAGKESAGVVLAKTDVGRHRHNRADGGARAADNDIDTFAELVAFGPASFSI
jgi:hypothetical protein